MNSLFLNRICRRTTACRLLFLLLLLLSPLCFLTAQEQAAHSPLDSLLTAYDNGRGAERSRTADRLLDYCRQQAVFFDEAPKLEPAVTDAERDLIVWFAAARCLTTTSYYKEALTCIERALGEGDDGVNGINGANGIHETLLCDKAYCLYKTSDYTGSVEAGQQAIHLCQQTGNTLQLSRAYLYISLVNHALRKYDEAKALVVKAIETNRLIGEDNIQLHNALGIACEIFCSAQEVDKAIDYGQQAVDAAHAIGYLPGVANHLTQLSYAYDRKGDYEQGLRMADSAIAIVMSQEPIDRNQLALTLEYKSWNLIDIGRHADAVESLEKAIQLEEELGNTHAAWYDYRTLAEAKTPIDPQGAIAALNRYVKMSDSIHSEQLKELMSQANAEFHNDELKEVNTQSRRMNRIIIATSLVIVILLAAIIASLWFAFRQKKHREDMLRRLTEVREQFFTNVTHEFRTPLTVILGMSREIQHLSDLNGKQALEIVSEAGSAIERQGEQLLALVNKLLDISKVQSAIGPQQQTQGDLAAYIGMIVEVQREVARQKGVVVSYQATPTTIPASFTPDYVEKVVGNLLSNAVKFTDSTGEVQVTLHAQGRHLVLSVKDTGRGIAPRDLPRIFEPFYQADNAAGQGSGIGLALVRQIVETLGGTVQVESELGKGSKFTVRLDSPPAASPAGTLNSSVFEPPVREGAITNDSCNVDARSEVTNNSYNADVRSEVANDVNNADARSEHSAPSLTGRAGGESLRAGGESTILIVEDNADVARLITLQLLSRYVCLLASNGKEAIKKARQKLPDLIITDIMMPDTDGLQLCRTVREDPLINHIPIIIVSAKTTEDDRIRGLEAGADAYLFKPFSVQELIIRIQKLLELRDILRQKYALPAPVSPIIHSVDSTDSTEKSAAFAQLSGNFMDEVHATTLRLLSEGSCSVEAIAAQLYVTPSQLRRKMNAITGISPKKYIMKVRMEMARELLLTYPEIKIATIAERCGFTDHSHFIRLYKETYGTTPSVDRI